ncbi:MAG: Maf family protein [Chloroflexia bacterium]
MALVLASNSPRRQELLGVLGLPYAIRVAEVDESVHLGETPEAMVARLAREKALAVPLSPKELLISADTTVELEGQALGKPADPEEARRMLRLLRGRMHRVHTAVALRRGEEVEVQVVTTRVWMRNYGAEELEAYLASGQAQDKAGAYGIQDEPFAPVERVEGCYMNVVGLPLCHLAQGLVRRGISIPRLPPAYCRGLLGHPCPVALF